MKTCERCGKEISRSAPSSICATCQKKEEERAAAHLKILPIKTLGSGMIIWPFNEAPKVYQEMSQSGGDEDWVALIPPNFNKGYLPFWLESLDSGRNPEHYKIAEGYEIIIGSH